ncbi:pyridoxal phosphate-dependent decarboxylase family protein [Croceitalea rosinachiae]|uniref:Aminotransferase class I/II-fold pyridoxal phosphate-dependent enzyme n=1 Tax=Croceitalea rosinachiae TaxID=3075596 RepID=A0ABU3AC86_9FLAO|nr:aminotransferase class I/II-fold pyridoxal phosphate-dependent enzyme [Croceitalea sp. F388]MDT0607157.1 aminotransferase class I/II-fold pyridoxal phosphate-dependent enzyme [Croceitalea sp. F388]
MSDNLLKNIYTAEEFEKNATKLFKMIKNHLQNTTTGKADRTLNWNEPDKELNFWKVFLENGKNEDFFTEILKRSTHTHHPKYVGHQVSASAPITILTAMVSALLNNGMAVYEMGMSPSAIEKVVTDSICEKIGYTSDFGGFLTSGGTLANLTALLSARKAKVSHNVWTEGYLEPLGIMVCEQAHYCIDRAAKIMGLGEKGIIKVPSQESFAMDIKKLEVSYNEARAKGIKIFAIVGSAPSTATGAYDDLLAIADFAKDKNLWFHVDGAHGGAAIYSEKYKHLLNGIAQSDSVVIDGHKMMLMPTITTALLFKNKVHAQHTFSQRADYLLHDTEEEDWINSGKKTFECTKTMMCMHWYILLKFYGEEVFDEFVTRQYDLAKDFENTLQTDPNFELATSPMSNILCFRYTDSYQNDERLNQLNTSIRQELLEEGEFYLVQTKLRNIHYLRTSLMNPFTTVDHLNLLVNRIKEKAELLLNKN